MNVWLLSYRQLKQKYASYIRWRVCCFPEYSPLYWRALFDVSTVRDDMAELAQGEIEIQICGLCIK